MPLSWKGLCEAETITPRSARSERVRKATAGVGIGPTSMTSMPGRDEARRSAPAPACSPRAACPCRSPRGAGARRAGTAGRRPCPAPAPPRRSSGGCWPGPRMPSVPNSRRSMPKPLQVARDPAVSTEPDWRYTPTRDARTARYVAASGDQSWPRGHIRVCAHDRHPLAPRHRRGRLRLMRDDHDRDPDPARRPGRAAGRQAARTRPASYAPVVAAARGAASRRSGRSGAPGRGWPGGPGAAG